MKKYRQLVTQLPSKKIVLGFNEFQSPSAVHEVYINSIKKLASSQKADHVIFASCTEDKKIPLPVDRKIYFLERMFPKTNFLACNEVVNDITTITKVLFEKYKHVTIVTSQSQVTIYEKLLHDLNVQIIGIQDFSPNTKIVESLKKGDFSSFKKTLPFTITELDSKRLMNEMRLAMGLKVLKEQVKFETNELREKYFAGEIFNIGEIVESDDTVYEIVKRGSNHLLLQDEKGNRISKFPQELQLSNKEFVLEELNMPTSQLEVEKVNEAQGLEGAMDGAEDTLESDLSDKQIDDMVGGVTDDHVINHCYDDHELCIIDDETGEHLHDLHEEVIMEVLSRMERIKAKVRFARSESKRERKTRVALKTHSNVKTINGRARRLAIQMMKLKIAKRPLDKLSVSDKERIERMMAKRKVVINRLAMKLVPRVRKTENDRLSHKNYTKEYK